MIADSFQEVHSKAWIKAHILDPSHELVILRQVIPWQKMIDWLQRYYCSSQGRFGKSLRLMVAVLILGKLRQVGDQAVIDLIKENRYGQYFCNVSERDLSTFLDRSTVCKFRHRIGPGGSARIEHYVFDHLRRSGVIENDAALMDSTVLENNLIYPNDVQLLYKALVKLKAFAQQRQIALWWDHTQVKRRWRAFNLAKSANRMAFLQEFDQLFQPVLRAFKELAKTFSSSDKKKPTIGCGCSICSTDKQNRNWPASEILKTAWSRWMNGRLGPSKRANGIPAASLAVPTK